MNSQKNTDVIENEVVEPMEQAEQAPTDTAGAGLSEEEQAKLAALQEGAIQGDSTPTPGEPPKVINSLADIFTSQEQFDGWLAGIANQMIQLWANNDSLRAVVANPKLIGEVEQAFRAAWKPNMQPQLESVIHELCDGCQWVADENEPAFRAVTMREAIGTAETFMLKHWASNELRIYNYFERKGISFLPTTQELRQAFLTWHLIKLYEESPKIATPGGGFLR